MRSLTLSAFIVAAACATAAASSFCTLEGGTSRMIEAAETVDLPDDEITEQVTAAAQNIIEGKMAANPDGNIRITWADVYKLRRIANSLICSKYHNPAACAGAAVDYAGEGLTGTAPGQLLTMARLTGPIGFMLGMVMDMQEEHFQCDASTVRAMARGTADFVLYLPICKTVGHGCVELREGAQAGAARVISEVFGEDTLKLVRIDPEEAGKFAIKVVLKPVKGGIKTDMVDGAEAGAQKLDELQQQAAQYQGEIDPAYTTLP